MIVTVRSAYSNLLTHKEVVARFFLRLRDNGRRRDATTAFLLPSVSNGGSLELVVSNQGYVSQTISVLNLISRGGLAGFLLGRRHVKTSKTCNAKCIEVFQSIDSIPFTLTARSRIYPGNSTLLAFSNYQTHFPLFWMELATGEIEWWAAQAWIRTNGTNWNKCVWFQISYFLV